MKRHSLFIILAMAGLLLLGFLAGESGAPLRADNPPPYQLPEGVSIKLTKEFYEALKAEGTEGVKVYTNDPSREYLRQIAVASRYMVESNLQILRNQEKIIRLLESGKETRIK